MIALRDHICAPPASRALMERVGSPDKQALLKSYNQRGLPLVVLHDSNGKEAPIIPH